MASSHLSGPLYVDNGLYVGGAPVLTSRISNKTDNYSILAGDEFTTFTTLGAAGSVTFSLPAAVGAESYTFVVGAQYNLVVRAGVGAVIALGESISTSGGTMTAEGGNGGLYAVLGLTALSPTLWVATTSFGPWSPA